MQLFQKTISFRQPDPLGDGLGDEIRAEQAEPEHFNLFEQLDGGLVRKWDAILIEAHNDPDFTSVYGDD